MAVACTHSSLVRSVGLVFSVWVFAVFIHASWPWRGVAWLALPVIAFIASDILAKDPNVLLDASLWKLKGRTLRNATIGALLGLFLAVISRNAEDMPLIPVRIGWFVLLSIFIGFMEEIFFRGLLQGEAEKWNKVGAVILAATAFAGYKALLFVHPSTQNVTSVPALFGYTFLAGIALGFSRLKGRSMWPPVIAHAIFDLWLYMDTFITPWWVW